MASAARPNLLGRVSHSRQRRRRDDDQRRVDAPQRDALRRQLVRKILARRPGRLRAKHGDLRRLGSRLVPLSAEIDVEPSVLGEDGDDCQNDGADDEPPAAGDA